MCSKVRLQPKKYHHSKHSDLPRINITTTVIPEVCTQFAESVKTALEGQPAAVTMEERWHLLRDTIHSAALSIFSKERQNPDWYDESLPVMEPAINAKRDALMNYKREPSNNNLAALRSAKNEAQRTARHCANQYWLNLCHSIQEATDYRGISLLRIVREVFARVALQRLQQVTEKVYPESQCGFRVQRSTIDMIFALRQLQGKCQEQKQSLFIVFVDLTKAFDLVSRKGLFHLLDKIGCPQKLLKVVMSFHEDMKGTVLFDSSSKAA